MEIRVACTVDTPNQHQIYSTARAACKYPVERQKKRKTAAVDGVAAAGICLLCPTLPALLYSTLVYSTLLTLLYCSVLYLVRLAKRICSEENCKGDLARFGPLQTLALSCIPICLKPYNTDTQRSYNIFPFSPTNHMREKKRWEKGKKWKKAPPVAVCVPLPAYPALWGAAGKGPLH